MRRKEGASPVGLWCCCRALCWGRWGRGCPGGQGWTWGPATVSPGSSNVPWWGPSELGWLRGLRRGGLQPNLRPSGPGGATTTVHRNPQTPSTEPRGHVPRRVPPKHQADPCPQSPWGCPPGQPPVPGHACAPTLQHYCPGAAPGVQQPPHFHEENFSFSVPPTQYATAAALTETCRCFPRLGVTTKPSRGSIQGCNTRVGTSIADTSGCCSPHRAGTPSISVTPRGHDGPGCSRLLPRSGPTSGIPPVILFNKHFCLCSSSALRRTQPQPSAAPQGGERGSPRPPGHAVPWKGMGHGMEPVPPVPVGSTAQCPATTAPRVGGWQSCLEPPPCLWLWGSTG